MTNCTESNRCSDISYGGTSLGLDGKKYYWKIRYWDQVGSTGTFSDCTDNFTIVGPLNFLRHGKYFFNLTDKRPFIW